MPDETRKPIVEILDREESLPGMEFRTDMPLAASDVVPVGDRDLAVGAKGRLGQLAEAGEVRDRLGGMRLHGDASAAMAAALANIPDVGDEIDNATAAAMRGRRNGPPRGPAFAGADIPGEGVAEDFVRLPPPPQNLPAVLAGSVFARDPNYRAEPMVVQPKWLNIDNLPGYMSAGIRALGRFTFRSFGCFGEHERQARAAGQDPLGEIKILADMQGQGPSKRAELDAAATWIRDNGTTIEASELDFGMAIPGYNPRVILSATDEESFLLVEDTRARGAPCDAMYIYSWKGGRAWYLAGEGRLAALAGMAERRAIGAPARQLGPPPGHPAAFARQAPARAGYGVPAQLRPAPPQPAPVAPIDKAARREKMAKLQEAPARSGGLSIELRRNGFLPLGSQSVPTLRKAMEDGFTAEIVAPVGQTLAGSPELELKIVDADGEVWNETSVSSMSDVEAAMSAHRLPAP